MYYIHMCSINLFSSFVCFVLYWFCFVLLDLFCFGLSWFVLDCSGDSF